jgi:hypothetical protein
MSAISVKGDGLGRLVDRHAELCEVFNGNGSPACVEAPVLIAPNGGKTSAECIADLVDQALAVYGGTDFAQDPRIIALKIALTDAIVELA